MVGAAVVPEGGQREKASTFAELVEHVTLPAWRLQERLLDSDKALRIPGRKVTEAYTLKGAEFGHRNAGIEWNVARHIASKGPSDGTVVNLVAGQLGSPQVRHQITGSALPALSWRRSRLASGPAGLQAPG